jgi:hypothetical protein
VVRLTELNNAAVPAVPEVTTEDMSQLLGRANWSVVLEHGDGVAGMVICFDSGQDYDSENYRYFESHYGSHFYIDRIVIDEQARGMGFGALLYGEVFGEAARRSVDQVTCEVNLEPPNPASIAFHHRMGFVDVDTQATKGGTVVVQLMAARVNHG